MAAVAWRACGAQGLVANASGRQWREDTAGSTRRTSRTVSRNQQEERVLWTRQATLSFSLASAEF